MTNRDTILSKEQLNIKDTLECGQVFRYTNFGSHYALKAQDKSCILYYSGNNTIIESDDAEYFRNYFDLATDYQDIKAKLYGLPFMSQAIPLASGIRILRQEPFETIISFIISANNHIPRIKSIIERISKGQAFPTPQELAKFSVEELRALGLGFRDRYVHNTANDIASGRFDINSIIGMSSQAASKNLCTLQGVGAKVADCILLFGYHKTDVFPVDTWIKKTYNAKFGQEGDAKQIRKLLLDIYGDLSGYAQQYLFYGARSKFFI